MVYALASVSFLSKFLEPKPIHIVISTISQEKELDKFGLICNIQENLDLHTDYYIRIFILSKSSIIYRFYIQIYYIRILYIDLLHTDFTYEFTTYGFRSVCNYIRIQICM